MLQRFASMALRAAVELLQALPIEERPGTVEPDGRAGWCAATAACNARGEQRRLADHHADRAQ